MNSSAVVPPRPPAVQKGILSGPGQVSVEVIWLLSPDDGAGNGSVTRYDVYRGSSYDPSGAGYQLVASVLNGTASYEDPLRGEGDPNSYFYRVCAVDSFSNMACADVQAGKFTRPLSQGSNHISIPLIQSNGSIETVLQTVEYDKAWVYDPSSQEWMWFMKHKGYRRGLWDVNHTIGIWVNITQNSSLTIAGVVPTQSTIHLRTGWNLVSFPSFNVAFSVADLKAEIGAMRLEGCDPAAPPNFLRVLTDVEVLRAGQAYWIKVDADADWIVEVS